MAALQEISHWGIDPIPLEHRRLRPLDIAVLWGNLGVGLLVVVTGGLLTAPPDKFGFGLSLPAAIATTIIGSIIGCALLALGGAIGANEGRPTMALFRPVLGDRGSWIPSALNAGQLLGWTAFELWAMASVASALSQRIFGGGPFLLWLIFFATVALGFSLWGPLGVVRGWMERFSSWVLIAMGVAVTIYLLIRVDVASLWRSGGAGGALILGIPLDLVIVMPVSWLPLVADYTRFSTRARGSFWGTFTGYLVANIWFYVLGAVLLMTPDAGASPEGVAAGLLALGGISITGTLLLAGLLVGESDQAFANIYSGAMSLRNIFPRVDSRILVVSVAVVGTALAARLTMLQYELFLFLLGSVFIPLLGIWFADYFVLRNRVDRPGVRLAPVGVWVAGFLVYHWIAPTPLSWWSDLTSSLFGEPLSAKLPWLGASLPALLLAFGLHCLLGRLGSNTEEPEVAAEPLTAT